MEPVDSPAVAQGSVSKSSVPAVDAMDSGLSLQGLGEHASAYVAVATSVVTTLPSAAAEPMQMQQAAGTSDAESRIADDSIRQPHDAAASPAASLPISMFAKAYAESDLARRNTAVLQTLLVPAGSETTSTRDVESGPNCGPADGNISGTKPLHFTAGTARSFVTQLRWVYTRACQDYWRNDEMNEVRLFITLFLAILFGILFINVDRGTFQGTQSTIGFILGGVVFGSTLFFSTGITAQFERREVFYRERASRYYSTEAYSISAFLVEAPYVVVFQLMFVSIIYWMASLKPTAGAFFFFYLGALLMGAFFTATSVAYGAIMPSLPVAQIIGGLTISLSFLFAGLFIPRPGIPKGWIGLYYAVPTSHVLRALATNQFYCAGSDCPRITTITPDGPVSVDRYEYVSSFVSSTYSDRWANIGWAALAVGVMIMIALLGLRFVNHNKR